MPSIKLAHFSDLHYAGATLDEVDRCFTYAVDQAIRDDVQCAVITGDATDHALDVHSPAVARLAANVRRLADHCPILMLQGTFSHEPPGTLAIFRLLGGKHPVHVADRISQAALLDSGRWVESDGWAFPGLPDGTRALFTCLPTVNKAVIGAVVGAENAAEAAGEQIALLLRGYQPINQAARDADVPTIGVSHGTVYGSVSEHGVAMAGFDHEYTTASLFASGVSAFMLGHIHLHQAWNIDRRRIAYAGSIGRLHYGELGEKGYLAWSVDAEGADFRLMPTPSKRTIEISFDAVPDMEALRRRAAEADVEGAFIRVRWNVPEEDRHQVNRAAIEALFAGAAETKLEGRIIPTVRARSEGISLAPSLGDKVKAWAEVASVEADPLLRCLQELETATPEDIVQNILGAPAPSRSPASASCAPDTHAEVPVPAVAGAPHGTAPDLFGDQLPL